MSGEMYAILAYAVGLGLIGAYSLRLCARDCLLRRRERRVASAEAVPAPPRVEKPVVVAGVAQVRTPAKIGHHAGHA